MPKGRQYTPSLESPLFLAVFTRERQDGTEYSWVEGPYSTLGAARGARTYTLNHRNSEGTTGKVFALHNPQWEEVYE